ncbi:hypothetical protein DID76_02150 [Candidatus Marinamargulisbacteria bacterium SCGC AG-414-C22]|nr:hypothetical protein DID76_02150 [Candidatus Marinamargulisbacteria bacterium SCGC AG-414-C22]
MATLTNANQLTNPSLAQAINVYKNAATGVQDALGQPQSITDRDSAHLLLLVAFTSINQQNDGQALATALVRFCSENNISDDTANDFLELGNPTQIADIEDLESNGAGCQGGSSNCASCGGCQPVDIPANWQLTIASVNTICENKGIPL